MLRDLEKARDKAKKEAYFDPELAEKQRVLGNEQFKAGNYVQAKKEYDEAIARNPKDAKLYANRATALMKLMAHPDALKDCEEAIKLDPTYIKAYAKKGQCYFVMKDNNKALQAYMDGLKQDPNDEGCLQGQAQIQRVMMHGGGSEADPERVAEAMKDPEIQQILHDPQMNMILQQMQQDPKMAAKAMESDPKIANAIQKLVLAGIIRTA